MIENRRALFLSVLLALLLPVHTWCSTVVGYDTPSLGPLSSVYRVTVNGKSVPAYAFQRNGDTPDYFFTHFSFSGTVQVDVEVLPGVGHASLSPLAFGIPIAVKKNHVRFKLNQSRYLILKVDAEKELVLAADPPETDVPAAHGPGIFNLRDFGADPTGHTLATEAFTKAFAAAAEHAGGGTVYVPDGLYTVGNLVIGSHTTLYLAGNAVVQAAKDASIFNRTFRKSEAGNHGTIPEPGTWLVSTQPNSTDITIRGRGVIDGSGSYLTDPSHGYLLEDLIVPLGTSHFMLDGIVGWDAGFWALTPDRSNHVTITNYKGMQSLQTYQNDGIDIDEDQDVLIRHTIVVSRDDCYSTKTWGHNEISQNWPGDPQAVRDVLIQDAVAWTTDGAFKIGQGDYQSHSRITVDGGYVYQAHWAIYLRPDIPKSAAAAPVSDVTIRNLDVEANPRTKDGKRFAWLDIELPWASLSNVSLSDIRVRTQGALTTIVTANTGHVEGLHLRNIRLEDKQVSSLDDLGVATSGAALSGITFVNAPK